VVASLHGDYRWYVGILATGRLGREDGHSQLSINSGGFARTGQQPMPAYAILESKGSPGASPGTCDGPDPPTLTRREHYDGRAWLHPIKEIDDILVGHADAAG
jgi:hypothetical protein